MEKDEEELKPEAEWNRALEPVEETPEKPWRCPGCIRRGEKGPLDEPTAETFEWYLPHKLESRSTFYRQWGPPAKLTGSRGGTYYSFFPPAGSEDFMRDQMSLPPKWNSMKNTTEVTFPAGTVVYIGPAAAKEGYSGGGFKFSFQISEECMAGILRSVTDGLTITEYEDWLIFVQRLQELVRSGRVRRVPQPVGNRRFAKEDEWYLDPETGETYVHVIPDAPVLPQWVKVDLLAPVDAPEPHANDLSVIPTGKKSRLEAKSLKGILEFLVHQGAVEALDPSNIAASGDSAEKWFKDLQTKVIYRLVERRDGDDNRWERVPQSEVQMRVQ